MSLTNDLILVFHVHAVVGIPPQNRRNLTVKYHQFGEFFRNIFWRPKLNSLVTDLLREAELATWLYEYFSYLRAPERVFVYVTQEI